MAKKTTYKFNKEKLAKDLMARFVKEQTKRLLKYAREELYEMILTREFKSQTFNLADSYVWAVYYNGDEKGHGFVGSKRATRNSVLHEYSSDPSKRIPVDGRKEATRFLTAFATTAHGYNGWVIVWAACAPYGRYLDPSAGSSSTNRFFVISQRYDHIKATLEPKCKVTFKVGI